MSATEANEKGCAGVGSIPLREPSTRSRRGSRRVEGPGARRLARLGPARRKHGAPEGRARSSPWHSWCCSLVPGRTSPWSSGLLSFHSLQLDFVRVRNTPACTGAPLFFSLTLRRRRRTSDKISSSGIQKFPPPPQLFPIWFQIKTHKRNHTAKSVPRATRSDNGHRSHGGARPRNRHLARRLSGLAKGVEDRARVKSGARRLSLAARRAFLGLDRSAVSRAADDAPVCLSAQLEAFGPQGGFVYVEGVVDQGVRVGRAGRGGCWLEGEGPSAAVRDDKAGQGRGPGRGEEEEEDCGGRGRRRG